MLITNVIATDSINFNHVNSLTIEPEYKSSTLIEFTGTKFGIVFWGEYCPVEKEMSLFARYKSKGHYTKKVHEIHRYSSPTFWNYCLDVCEEL